MRLIELLMNLSDVADVAGDPQVDVSQITADSRQVIPGACFVAYQGLGVDGHRFIPDAIARGAAAVVGEHTLADLPVAYARVADGRAALAWLCAAWYGNPSRSMALVGITGTDGKTTTANLLFNILKAASHRVGLISTVHAVIGDQTYSTGLHTTTPDAPDVQRFLAQMRDAGTEIAVLETTSHGLAQHRVTGCAFDVAVVTNITHEHLDFHGSYEAYREAKALLFRSLTQTPGGSAKSFEWFAAGTGLPHLPKTAVLNRDDSSFEHLARIPAEQVITYGAEEPLRGSTGAEQGRRGAEGAFSATALHLTAVSVRHSLRGLSLTSSSPRVSVSPCPRVTSSPRSSAPSMCPTFWPRWGRHLHWGLGQRPSRPAYGPRRASLVGWSASLQASASRRSSISRTRPTPWRGALEAVRPLAVPGGRVIVVFGSAGLRDREKRHLMGEVAARLADVTVVTAEDPRTEDLSAIMAETATALAAGGRVEGVDFFCIADRQRAILHAVRLAGPGRCGDCLRQGPRTIHVLRRHRASVA